MSKHFFTGFPGFIATQIIKGLIRAGDVEKIYVLAEKKQMDRAAENANLIVKELNVDTPVQVICGDITKPNLGMNSETITQLAKESLMIWHLAAIYDLAVKEDIAWRVNVEGTISVNEYVRAHAHIVRYIYFSTAYVAGKREGVLLETELIRPEAFKNYYEETKFEAELLVEGLKPFVPVTIIRPGIVRGHSKTGETIKFDGPYFFMNMIDRLKWMPIIPYVGRSTACLNVVPIDYIIDASIYLSRSEGAEGKTVHLTDPAPHPVEEIYRSMAMELTGKKPRGRFPHVLAAKGLSSIRVQRLLGVEEETLDYLTWNASFDTTIAKQLLKGSGIECADFIQSLPAMVSFYNENKKNAEFHVKIG